MPICRYKKCHFDEQSAERPGKQKKLVVNNTLLQNIKRQCLLYEFERQMLRHNNFILKSNT